MKFGRYIFLSVLALAGAVLQAGQPSSQPLHPSSSRSRVVISVDGNKASTFRIMAKRKSDGKSVSYVRSRIEPKNLMVEKRFNSVPGLTRIEHRVGGQPKELSNKELLQKIQELRDTGLYEYVEPDWQVRALQIPTDSSFTNGDLWGLRNTGQNGGVSGIDIDAVNAWGVNAGGSSTVVVGVIDSGIRYTHQDLAGNMWVNPGETPGNGIDDDSNGYIDDIHGINAINDSGDPMDDNDHGSHVAGTISATANDSGRHVGVAYNTKLMALKFLGANGFGSLSDAIECIDYAVAEGVDILNNSWGGGGFSQALLDSIEAANAAGVLFVAAAGNSALDNDSLPAYPASYDVPNVISVAAIDRRGRLANFSNFGATSVDIGAPGVEILSCTSASDSSYESFQGTSMASPHVAGVAALLLSQFPGASVAELRNRLLDTAEPLTSLEDRTLTGGMVDAFAALQATEDGILELSVIPEGTLQAGDDETFFVEVSDILPVTGADVQCSIDGGTPVTFVDDGTGVDPVANDGFYSGQLTIPTDVLTVTVDVSVTATGKTPGLQSFEFQIVEGPPNDDFDDRIAVFPFSTSTTGSNVNATSEVNEPVNPFSAGGLSVWWEWTAEESGTVTIDTNGSDYDTTLAIYTGTALAGLNVVGSDDDAGIGLASAVTFDAEALQTYIIQVDGFGGDSGQIQLNYPDPFNDGAPIITAQPQPQQLMEGEDLKIEISTRGSDLHYQWYFNGIPIQHDDVDAENDKQYWLNNVTDANEGTYHCVVTNEFGEAVSNGALVTVTMIGPRPVNDDFANAVVLPGVSGTETGTNQWATRQQSEGDMLNLGQPVESVWYVWTAPADGILTVDTVGSAFDTLIGLYGGGTTLGNIDLIRANNNALGTAQSSVSARVTNGSTYYIAVDGVGGANGDITLNYDFMAGMGAPVNDQFANRIILPAASTTDSSHNLGATGQDGDNEYDHADVSRGRNNQLASIWWEFTPPADGAFVVTTEGSNFNTTLAIYEGTDIRDLTPLVSNINENAEVGMTTSRAGIENVAGTTYQIAVDGVENEAGLVELELIYVPGGSLTGKVLFVDAASDGFFEATSLLTAEGYLVTSLANEAFNEYENLLDTEFLSDFDVVIYCERGEFGLGELMSDEVKDSLETYIQEGGHLLVTGYDTLGSPTDTNLAALVRSAVAGDRISGDAIWSVLNVDHPILNGPFGDFRGQIFTATGYDDDDLLADEDAGAINLVNTGSPIRKTTKLIYTDLSRLPDADPEAGSVGYWNGGESGSLTNPQPDFTDGGIPQAIFLNYVELATEGSIIINGNLLVFNENGGTVTNRSTSLVPTAALGGSSEWVIKLHNPGHSKLELISLEMTGSHRNEFAAGNFPSAFLNPGQVIEIPIRFTPTFPGNRRAALVLTTNDKTNPSYTINLVGEGLANTDGDKASDQWESKNGFDPYISGDIETMDSDQDGNLDIWEIFQGTSPTDSNEYHRMKVTASEPTAGKLEAEFRRDKNQTEVEAIPLWSPDLVNWYKSGESAGGVKVLITESVTDHESHEIVNTSAEVIGGNPTRLFFTLELNPKE